MEKIVEAQLKMAMEWQSGNVLKYKDEYCRIKCLFANDSTNHRMVAIELSNGDCLEVAKEDLHLVDLKEIIIRQLGYKESEKPCLNDPLNNPTYRIGSLCLVINDGKVCLASPCGRADFGFRLSVINYLHQLQNLPGSGLSFIDIKLLETDKD